MYIYILGFFLNKIKKPPMPANGRLEKGSTGLMLPDGAYSHGSSGVFEEAQRAF